MPLPPATYVEVFARRVDVRGLHDGTLRNGNDTLGINSIHDAVRRHGGDAGQVEARVPSLSHTRREHTSHNRAVHQ